MSKNDMREVMILNDASDYKCMLFHQWISVREHLDPDHTKHEDYLYGICESEQGTIELIEYNNIQFKG